MERHVEIVQIVDGRVFDAECYECATVSEDAPGRPGFYAVLRHAAPENRRLNCRATFIGPFASARQAESAFTAGGGHP